MSHSPARFGVKANVLNVTSSNSLGGGGGSSSSAFTVGGRKGRVEAVLGQVGAHPGGKDRYFASEKGREEHGVGGSALAVVQESVGGVAGRVQVWTVGGGGVLLCEVGPKAMGGRIVCWEAHFGVGDDCCWLLLAHSGGAILHVNLCAAASAVAANPPAPAAPSEKVPHLIQSLALASKLLVIPGERITPLRVQPPNFTTASHHRQRRCPPSACRAQRFRCCCQATVENCCQEGAWPPPAPVFMQ